jgi:hypothetical protein
MPKGGHARSGPPRDPKSRTSERRGFTPTTLPASGFDGKVPALSDYLPDPSPRHEKVWADLWRTPQACMWDRDPFRIYNVANLVRCQVRAEASDSPAAWENPIDKRMTEAGLTEAGLRFNGWAIAEDQLAAKRDEQAEAETPKGDEVGQRRQKRLR